MSARRRKYKALLDTSHGEKPLNTIFFLDRDADGKVLAQEMRNAGNTVERHKDHFEQTTPDSEWLRKVGANGWVVITRDKKIARNHIEIRALMEAKVKAFAIVSHSLNGREEAEMVIKALPAVISMVNNNEPPFIARIRKDGTVVMWKHQTKNYGRPRK